MAFPLNVSLAAFDGRVAPKDSFGAAQPCAVVLFCRQTSHGVLLVDFVDPDSGAIAATLFSQSTAFYVDYKLRRYQCPPGGSAKPGREIFCNTFHSTT